MQLQMDFGFPDPIPTHLDSIPVFFPGCLPLPLVLMHFLLALYLPRMSLFSCDHLMPSLPDFLHMGIESTCSLRRISPNSCQFCYIPWSLKAVSQVVTSTSFSNIWRFTLLKRFWLYFLPVPYPSGPGCSPDYHQYWPLQLVYVGEQGPVVFLLWLGCLSPGFKKNILNTLLDHLQLAVPLFQQLSGWLKSPSGVRAWKCDTVAETKSFVNIFPLMG